MEEQEVEFPTELSDKLSNLHSSLQDVERVLQPLLHTTVNEIREKYEPLERAKLDLVAAYALNSLFWSYLNAKGENPQEHDIKQELERIRGYMNKVKQIIDKKKMPRLNADAAKRFVRSSLWTPKDKEMAADAESDDDDIQEVVEVIQPASKRKKATAKQQIKNGKRRQ